MAPYLAKTDVDTLGLSQLAAICGSVDLPVVGIGGIQTDNYQKVLAAGARGAAIVSGILGADDIAGTVHALQNIYKQQQK